jgi:hypothetical protein
MKNAFIFISALILFISCNVFSPEERNVTLKIQGLVSDAINGSPVSNIEVELYKNWSPSLHDDYDKGEVLDSDITGEDGFYYLECKLYGDCLERYLTLDVIDSERDYDWDTISSTDEPHVRCIEGIQVINIQLEPYIVYRVPQLISPQEGEILDNGRTDGQDYIIWDFNWSDIYGATKYNLYVKHTGSQFPMIDEETDSSSFHREGSGYIADRNRFNWKWKVRLYANGRWCDWSEERSFDVEPVNTDPSSN